jgi:hypothetical protein
MQYIQGNNRKQAVLFPKCLDELVDQDNEVRKFSSNIRLIFFHSIYPRFDNKSRLDWL